MCWLSVVSIGTDLKACHRHHRGETFPSCVLCFCVPPVPSGSKPQVAVLAGKGVLVTYATPDQHHHEVPCHTALSTYRSRWQRTNTAFHVPHQAEACFKTDVAGNAAYPSAGHHLGSKDHQHVSDQHGLSWKVLATVVALEGYVAGGTADPPVPTSWPCICLAVQWFGGMNGFKDNQHVFGQSGLSWEFIFTVVALGFREGQGISVAGNQVPLEAVSPPKGFFTSPTGEGW